MSAKCGVAVLLGVGLFLVSWTAPARAQNPDEEARVHFRVGRAYFDSGRFAQAAAEFEAAFRLSNRNELLYNIFLAHREAGNACPAASAGRRYIELVADIADRDIVAARVTVMERQCERDGGPQQGGTPPGGGTEPSGGQTGGTTGSGAQGGGETGSGITDAPVLPPVGDPPDTSSGSRSIVVPVVLMGAGGALVLTGAITGIMALGKVSDLEDMCPMDRCPPGFEDTRDSGQTLALVTDILIPVGLITAGVGVALLVLGGGSSERADDAPRASVGCGPEGCNAELRLRF